MSQLTNLYQEILNCRKCDLCKQRTRAVPGEGSENPRIVFIGEAPGWWEDQQGRPFVGPAGQFLNELLNSIDLKREGVYICNVIKCRPPSNRDPLPSEIKACQEWLDKQLAIIKPKTIVTLGRYSMARYFPGETISKVHGKSRLVDGITCFAMYHPAAALHQHNLRQIIESDMKKIGQQLKEEIKPVGSESRPKQLSMFQE